jgi:hypothetical protein
MKGVQTVGEPVRHENRTANAARLMEEVLSRM